MFFENEQGTYTFNRDDLGKAHAWCQNSVTMAMKNELPQIFVSNTLVKPFEMKPYEDLAEKYGYTLFSLIVENRHGNKSIYNVKSNVCERMKSNFNIKL